MCGFITSGSLPEWIYSSMLVCNNWIFTIVVVELSAPCSAVPGPGSITYF